MATKLAVSIAAWSGACLALAGCSGAPVDDRPVVHIAPAAQPAVAIALGGFLPTSEELSGALGTGPNAFMSPVVEGGRDVLLSSVGHAQVLPADCVGAVYRLQEVVYEASPVLSVAGTSWAGGGFDAAPVSVDVGVVQMGSPAAAQKFFASATDLWRRCNGQTVTMQQPGLGAGDLSRITDVALGDGVVSATVLHASSHTQSPTGLRALGVVEECIVEVEVVDPRPAGDARAAVSVTELVLDRIATRR